MTNSAPMTPPASAATIPAASPSPSSWELARVAIERASTTDCKTILVLSFNAPSGDPLGWLAHHQGVPSVYWRARDGWEYAGLGAVHVIAGQGQESLRTAANAATDFVRDRMVFEASPQARKPRFFGGFSFDPGNPNRGPWSDAGFGDAVLVMPEAVYARRDTQSYLFFAFEVTPRSTPESLVDRLALLNEIYWHGFDCPSRVTAIKLHNGHADGDSAHSQWIAHTGAILHDFENSDLQKVVLARSQRHAVDAHTASPLNPWPLVAALRDFDPACYQFGFQFSDRYAFVGASPERLFRLIGRKLESEAVAGTIARGHDEPADRELAERLIASAKDQLEHRHVVEAVHEGLARLSANSTGSGETKFDVTRLRTLQHLRSVMSVDVRADVTVGDVLATLHPTPAVAGVPRVRALEAIRAHEIDARGWYGGPVGWVGGEAAEFAVGIRSALMNSNTAWLYAGAGLVPGSVPEEEWHEIEDKLQAFRSAVSSPRPTSQT